MAIVVTDRIATDCYWGTVGGIAVLDIWTVLLEAQ